jgi:uncharacterized membrane protein YfcA
LCVFLVFIDVDEATIVELAHSSRYPSRAAEALIQEASRRWVDKGDYMDDMAVTVLFINKAGKEFGFSAQFWTLFAGAASGFLGGLCGIRGPPIILYFLHPPYPVSFTKESQRATGACITATNVAMRVGYYLVDTLALDGMAYFEGSDWDLYLWVVVFSLLGVLVGSTLFDYTKDSKATIRGILTMFLLLCGVSLLLSSFMAHSFRHPPRDPRPH